MLNKISSNRNGGGRSVQDHGQFEFKAMPFRLSNTPTFEDIMNTIIRPYLHKSVLVFFDDILIFSKSWEEYVMQLEIDFKVLQYNVLKKSKCQFGRDSAHYLGHVLSRNGIQIDKDKI